MTNFRRSGLRAVIAIGLISAIIWYLGGPQQIGQLIVTADPFYVVCAFVVMTLDRVLMVFKWGILLRIRGIALPVLSGLRIYCAAMMWGLFVPSTVGVDAVRLYFTSRSGMNTKDVLASIIVERMIGFIASLLMGLLGLLILSYHGRLDDRFDSVWWLASGMLFVGVATFSLSFSGSLFSAIFRNFPERLRHSSIFERFRRFHETYVAYGASRRSIIVFFVLTFLEQLLTIVFTWITALALRVDVGLMFIAGVLPLTVLISRLPISLGGIGVFEGVFIILMALGGISAVEAVSIAFIGRIIQILVWFPWWATYSLQAGDFKGPTRHSRT